MNLKNDDFVHMLNGHGGQHFTNLKNNNSGKKEQVDENSLSATCPI